MDRVSRLPAWWITGDTEQLSKIPFIGDVPVLGKLFTSRSINKTKRRAARYGDAADGAAAYSRSKRSLSCFSQSHS